MQNNNNNDKNNARGPIEDAYTPGGAKVHVYATPTPSPSNAADAHQANLQGGENSDRSLTPFTINDTFELQGLGPRTIFGDQAPPSPPFLPTVHQQQADEHAFNAMMDTFVLDAAADVPQIQPQPLPRTPRTPLAEQHPNAGGLDVEDALAAAAPAIGLQMNQAGNASVSTVSTLPPPAAAALHVHLRAVRYTPPAFPSAHERQTDALPSQSTLASSVLLR